MSQLSGASPALRNEHPDIRRRRLLFRCWHRGTQEIDLILGSFAESSLAGLDSAQLDRFEALLDCSDPDLFDWIVGGIAPPPQHDHDVMRLLRGLSSARNVSPAQPKPERHAWNAHCRPSCFRPGIASRSPRRCRSFTGSPASPWPWARSCSPGGSSPSRRAVNCSRDARLHRLADRAAAVVRLVDRLLLPPVQRRFGISPGTPATASSSAAPIAAAMPCLPRPPLLTVLTWLYVFLA